MNQFHITAIVFMGLGFLALTFVPDFFVQHNTKFFIATSVLGITGVTMGLFIVYITAPAKESKPSGTLR